MALRATPDLAPTFPARIFCLARAGDWNAAALTLRTAQALGYVTPEEDALLQRFLEPELDDGETLPPPDKPTPLVWRMFEAIGRVDSAPDPAATAKLEGAESLVSVRFWSSSTASSAAGGGSSGCGAASGSGGASTLGRTRGACCTCGVGAGSGSGTASTSTRSALLGARLRSVARNSGTMSSASTWTAAAMANAPPERAVGWEDRLTVEDDMVYARFVARGPLSVARRVRSGARKGER